MATMAVGVVRQVGIATWTVLDDHTDRVRAVVSAGADDFTVCDERGEVLGRFPTVLDALEALPTLCN